MLKRLWMVFLFLLVFVISACTPTISTRVGDVEGNPADEVGNPDAPESLTIDEGNGENAGDGAEPELAASEQPQLPEGASPASPALFPTDWSTASPFPICSNQELTLTGVSYMDNGMMMVSFYDPFVKSGPDANLDPGNNPIFLEYFDEDGESKASYDCTKHPDAPALVYCFGEPMQAGSLVMANLAAGTRESVIIYDPTGSVAGDGDQSPEDFLAGYQDLDGKLLFPAFFGPNRDNLARIWGTNGTSLDPMLDLITADQAAEGLGFSGEVNTLVGLFNVLSTCQIAADQGWPLPDGCEQLGSAYYQPQTDCNSFSGCYDSCAAAMFLPSPDGESSLGKTELLEYLANLPDGSIPPACADYQYWSQGVLSAEEGESSGYPGSPLSPINVSCTYDPDNPFCTGEFWEDDADQESSDYPAEYLNSIKIVACAMNPWIPSCTGDLFGDASGDEAEAYSLCAAEIAWPAAISTYGEASDLLTYLLSIGPSVAQDSLPASCRAALDDTGEAFQTGVAGMLSGVIYSGTINSCVYQIALVVPSESQAGGFGGGQTSGGSGSSKPGCGPGLIAVLWKGNWICIQEN